MFVAFKSPNLRIFHPIFGGKSVGVGWTNFSRCQLTGRQDVLLSGGINSVIMMAKLLKQGVFSLTVDFHSKRDNLVWNCTSVYGPNDRKLKTAFWEELRACVGLSSGPWIIGGDFNAIFDLRDKPTGQPNLVDISRSTAFLQDMAFLEPPSIDRRFSWTNGQADPI
ncbi:DNase I-like protein [Dioscorea alata]|uniref:DNase I-like protein n=1 Tax=Dioscorea alata TaxID=55571 RepID=A0ACB7WLU0_DIOAL|nr:DNase I-like protein [Dioscorea alata]